MSDLNKVWIVILNWKNAPDTLECLDSIEKCNDDEIAGIVVCDNGSNDGSIENITNWCELRSGYYSHIIRNSNGFSNVKESKGTKSLRPVYVIENGANLGFAAGNNIGIEYVQTYCEYDFIYLLNNDTLIQDRTVSSMIERFKNKEKIGLCGSKVVYFHSPDKVQAYGGASFNRVFGRAVNIGSMELVENKEDVKTVEEKLDYILGASMMISKSCLEDIGLMEESYFLYYEEIDWAERARAAGYSLGYSSDSIVFHKEGATIGSSFEKQNRSLISTHYLTASKIKFTAKFHPLFLPSVYIFSLAQCFRSTINGHFDQAMTQFKALLLRAFK